MFKNATNFMAKLKNKYQVSHLALKVQMKISDLQFHVASIIEKLKQISKLLLNQVVVNKCDHWNNILRHCLLGRVFYQLVMHCQHVVHVYFLLLKRDFIQLARKMHLLFRRCIARGCWLLGRLWLGSGLVPSFTCVPSFLESLLALSVF